MTTLDAALAYARRGWAVVPLHAIKADGSCTCGRLTCENSRGKHPRLDAWQREASGDESKIKGWLRTWPTSNLGVATGTASGVVVIDIDQKPDKDGAASLARLEEQIGKLPPTLWARTGSGGRHLFFKHPGGEIRNAANLWGMPGVDVRGEAGQVVVEPSKHYSGGAYRWDNFAVEPAALPPAWVAVLTGERKKPAPPQPPAPPRQQSDDLLLKRASRYLATMPGAVSGQGGHTATLKAAIVLVRGFSLPSCDALRLLREEFNPRCSPAWSEKELEHKIASAEAAREMPFGALLREEPQKPPQQPQETREREPGDDDGDGPPHTGEQQEKRPALFPLVAVRDIPEIIDLAWLVRGVVPCFPSDGTAGYVFGPPKARKSLLLSDLALSVTSGTDFMGKYPVERQGSVVGFFAEDARAETSRRVHRLARGRGIAVPANLYLLDLVSLSIDRQEDQDRLTETLASITDLRLVFLDPTVRLWSGNENKVEELAPVHSFLRRLSRGLPHVVFIFAHHTNKAGEQRGSTEFQAFGDFNIFFKKNDDCSTAVEKLEFKSGPAGKPFKFSVEDGFSDDGATMRLIPEEYDAEKDRADKDSAIEEALVSYRQTHPGASGTDGKKHLRSLGLSVGNGEFWALWKGAK